MLPFEPYRGSVWRMIEGQYRPSTLKLTDSLEEQARLEELLDTSKPQIPPECAHLDYQFFTPFRYGRYPGASRFRREGHTPGVYYAAEEPLTAAIETAWGAASFFAASPGTPLPGSPTAHTAICATIAAPISLNLTRPDMKHRGPWADPSDYEPCCTLADDVRAEGCDVILYQSVRDPAEGLNVAVLTCAAFEKPAPTAQETWHLLLTPGRVILTREAGRQSFEFGIGETALLSL